MKCFSLVCTFLSSENQVHRNALQTEWQAFLNLCLAQETHLDHIEDYKKVKVLVLPCHTIPPNLLVHQSCFQLLFCSNQFQLEAEMLSDSLNKLKVNQDQRSLNSKSNSEVLLEIEVQLF